MLQRGHQKQHGRKERNELADGKASRLRFVKRVGNDHSDASHRDDLRNGRAQPRHDLPLQFRQPNLSIDRLEAIHFEIISVAHLDQALRLIGLLHAGQDASDGSLTVLYDATGASADHPKNESANRTDNASDERELPVLPEEHAKERHDLQRVSHQNDGSGDGASQCDVGFIDELRTDKPRRVLLVRAERPMKNRVEELRTERHEHVLTYLGKKIRAHDGGHCVEKRDADEGGRSSDNDPSFLLIKPQIRQLAQQGGGQG